MLRQIEECISVPHEKAPALRNAAGAFEGPPWDVRGRGGGLKRLPDGGSITNVNCRRRTVASCCDGADFSLLRPDVA